MSIFSNLRGGVGRRHERSKVWGVMTPFGQVLDISESGACVFRKGDDSVKVGDTITLVIQQDGIDLKISASVVRVQPLGTRRTEIGVAFLNATESDKQQLRQLAVNAGTDFAPTAFVAA